MLPLVLDVLTSYQLERHIRRERDERTNRLQKEVQLSDDFKALWDRIKPKTTYRVEFDTEELITQAIAGIKRMEHIYKPKVRIEGITNIRA